MRFSSLFVSSLAVAILSIAPLLSGLSDTAMSQTATPSGGTGSLPNVVVEAPKQVARPWKHRTVFLAPVNAERKTRKEPRLASLEIYGAAHAKVLDPDVRGWAPASARTYLECVDKLAAQGVGFRYQYYVCTSVGYKS